MSEAGAPQGVPGFATSSAGSARRGPLAGRRILLPRVKRKDALAAGLRSAGAEVEAVEVGDELPLIALSDSLSLSPPVRT